jgi:uncharacterized protein YndB with AHSA1/START domain
MADAAAGDALSDPIRISSVVTRTAADAFRLFTDGIGEWWPLQEGFSFGGARAKEVHLEAFTGGRFYERYTDGEEFIVGRVLACEPPHRIVFTFQGVWSAATEIEIRFVPQGAMTRVDFEQRGWQRLAPDEQDQRTAFKNGWPTLVARYTAAAHG